MIGFSVRLFLWLLAALAGSSALESFVERFFDHESDKLSIFLPARFTTSPATFVTSENCNLSAPAFCDTFNQGPSAIRGRGGDLDPSKWATARLSGEIGSSGAGTANPVPVAPIPQCRAGITQTSAFPPNDTLICDPNGTQSSQLMTAVSIQNYGVNSYMARQPFDFAGRTGKIDFDVDAVDQGLGGFIELELTEDPSPATTFREFQNFEVGPVPRNGLTLRFSGFAECPSAVAPHNTFVYNNYVGTIVTPTFNHSNGCAKVSRGSLNHFEVQVSQSHIDVYGSDFSTDNGRTFSNYKLLYSANINLPFTRGYVHFNSKNHATVKYGFGPNAVFHWDNIGFDGPVISVPRAYEITDNTTVTTYNGSQRQNLGYQLLDATTGKPAGIYSPSTKINSLAFQNVNTSGITSATLTLNAFFNTVTHAPHSTWGIRYRLNGNTWRNYNLTTGDLAGINAIAGAPLGILSLSIDVPTADLVSGTNTLELLPLDAPMDYPPVVANIDLLLGTSDSANPSPTPTPAAVNGACGLANGATVSSALSTNLCSTGTASSVADSGPSTWSCGGSNGGTVASCSTSLAPTQVNGETANCGMRLGGPITFCETFDNKNPGISSRTGDLDPNVWGVSRATGNVNFGQGQYNGWAAATQLQTCNGTANVAPPNDIMICNGQLREATNDNGGVTTLSMYPKQPFDFEGRTGTVSFDVSNDSHGVHTAWPEFWITNLPVPTPFNHFDSWQALPQHGFGIRFSASVAAGGYGSCPNGNNLDKRRWTVDSAVVVRSYVMDDTRGLGGVRTNLAVKPLDCVIAPQDNSGITNHVELKISQNQIDVYATDAGVAPSLATLKHIAVISNANLSFSRGLIWLQDVHYNADKAESGLHVPSQKQHTFVWDNVAFDGPFTYRDFSYDALDADQLNAATSTLNLGKFSLANQTAGWSVLNMPPNPQASTVRVLFNFTGEVNPVPTVLNVVVNGHAHPTPWPYPDTLTNTWRTLAVTIPITDVVPGINVVQLGADQALVTSNVNIVLVDVPGGVPVLPGANNVYPASGVSPRP
jgi:hypothetical protein